ncbi:hypothetical protein BH10BDE1_BH10BDE1_26240 [soil metagenome]
MNKHYRFFSLLVSALLMAPAFSFGDSELTGRECMPGFNAMLAKVRAVQRANSCSQTGNLADCKVQMGVGALAIGAAATIKATGLGGKVAQTIRDASSRPCPFVASRPSFSFLLIDSATAAGCTPQLDIERARINNAMDVVADELALRKKQAEQTLAALEKISEDVGSATGADRNLKIKAAIDKSVESSMRELNGAQKAYSAAQMSNGYQQLVNDEYEGRAAKSAKLAELKSMMRNWLGLSLDDSLYNFEEIGKRLSEAQRTQLNETRKALSEAGTKEYLATRGLSDIDRQPEVARLKARYEALNTQTVELKQMARSPEKYVENLNKTKTELQTSMAGISKSETAMADFRATLKLAKTNDDLYAIASRLHAFIPKESLLDPAKSAVATALKEAAAIANRVATGARGMTEPVLSLLAKYPAVAELAAGSRIVGGIVLRGLAFTGGLLVTGLTFAANDMQSNTCGDMTSSKIFPRDPKKGCSLDLSPNSATAQKIFEMDPSAMCQLMKENPEVKSMVDMNYSQAYPPTRAQCGTPMTFAIAGRGHATYDGKKVTMLSPGDPRETIVEFDANGNEYAIKFPKTSRGGGWDTLALEESPAFGSGDRFDRFTHDYRTQILPMIAEAGACCSDTGVSPTASECSRYGINSSPAGRSSPGASGAGSPTRR